jgi:hypothetical protein
MPAAAAFPATVEAQCIKSRKTSNRRNAMHQQLEGQQQQLKSFCGDSRKKLLENKCFKRKTIKAPNFSPIDFVE